MFARLSQVGSHLAHLPPTLRPSRSRSIMSAVFQGKISTAACLIIGDEVLGGKVCGGPMDGPSLTRSDGRYQLGLLCQILLLAWNRPQADRSHSRRRSRDHRSRPPHVLQLRLRRHQRRHRPHVRPPLHQLLPQGQLTPRTATTTSPTNPSPRPSASPSSCTTSPSSA